MKIAICQINPIIGDFEHNISLILEATERAKRKKCALAVFPEMSLIGYPPKDILEKPFFIRENLLQLQRLALQIEEIAVICGYVDRNQETTGKSLINSAALLKDGKIAGTGGKRLLPSYDVFDETRYFEPAQQSLVFELGKLRWGVTICEDIWNMADVDGIPRYLVDPVADLASEGIHILINISASPYYLEKEQLRLKILKKVCKTNGISAVYCNQVGGNDDLLFDGASMVVDARGRLIALGASFEPDILIWDTERSRPEIQDPWLPNESAILQGLIMGTRDYTAKCGFKKALVGLSGGIDSSLVAYIAREALGAENIIGVSMPSPYTSRMSRQDARLLAGNLGIRFEEISIGTLFDSYKEALKTIFAGLPEDETEENIQARIRGNLLMALSNKLNALLLTTGNKSEMAMGYCTLYGDMSGGLAVISDLPKTLCYKVARYINRDVEIIPTRIITRPPSAELRPNQTDQDSLPPYEILDGILEAAVEKNLGPEEIVAAGHDPAIVSDVLRRLVRNEYKRRQAPPGLKITSKAFGYGRRYPIARGKTTF
jgi:NAD+ synthase (glutamine-hydrolysing)